MGMRALAATGGVPDQGGRYIEAGDATCNVVVFSIRCDRHWQAHAMGAVNRCDIDVHDVGRSGPAQLEEK